MVGVKAGKTPNAHGASRCFWLAARPEWGRSVRGRPVHVKPLGQRFAVTAHHRLWQGIEREKFGGDNLPPVGLQDAAALPDDDVNPVWCAVQTLIKAGDLRWLGQVAPCLLTQFAQGCRNRRLAASQPAARRHPLARAVRVADQQNSSGGVHRQNAATGDLPPRQPPPVPSQPMCQPQPLSVQRCGDQVKHVTG